MRRAFVILELIAIPLLALLASGCAGQQPTPQQIGISALVVEEAIRSWEGKAPTPEFLADLRALGPEGEAAANVVQATWHAYQASTRPTH